MDNFLTLFDLIGELARRRYQTAERYFSALGFNHTEARLLTLLNKQNGEATQEALSNMLHVDRSNAGRALKSLEQKGYIVRHKVDADKRTNLVRLTAAGRTTASEISRLKIKMAQGFFGDLSEGEAGEIIELFSRTTPDDENA